MHLIQSTESTLDRNRLADHRISIVVAALYIIQVANAAIKTVLPISENLWTTLTNIGFLIAFIFLAVVMVSVIKRELLVVMLSFCIAVLFVFSSMILSPKNVDNILDRSFWMIGVCMTMGLCAISIENKKIYYDTLLKSSFIISVILSVVFFVDFNRGDSYYNMAFSYALLLPLLLHINEGVNKKSILFWLAAIYEIILILLYGARGPLLCVLIFMLLKLVLYFKKKPKYILVSIILLSIILLTIILWEQISALLLEFLNAQGIQSRTLYSLLNGSIFQDSGRGEIQSSVMTLIQARPLTGWGIAGEVPFVGTYPHNIFLELLCDWGFIIGGIMIGFIVVCLFQLFLEKDNVKKELLMIYTCCGFVPLLISGTLYENYNFIILIFLAAQIFFQRNFARGKRSEK